MKYARKLISGQPLRGIAAVIGVLLIATVFAAPIMGDEIETKEGTVYKGKLIKELHDTVIFQASIGGVRLDMKFPIAKVKSVTVNGTRRMVKPGAKATSKTNPIDIPASERTETQIDDLVEDLGRRKPDWFDGVTLRTPKTLNLNWRVTSRGIKPHSNLRQYIDMIITPDPSKWKEGVKLLHHTLTINRSTVSKLRMSQRALADMYFNYFGDYARAAFWYRQARGRTHIKLATCYYRLGCKALAVKVLKEVHDDNTPDGSAIRLWSEMGEVDKAVYHAENSAKAGLADIAYLAAGDAYRRDGQYNKALTYYQKVLDAEQGSRLIKRNSARAKANVEAVKLQAELRLSKIPDGTYQGQALGYEKTAPIVVSVTMADGSLNAVRVVGIRDKQYFISKTEMPKRIIAKHLFLSPPLPDPGIKIRRRNAIVIKEPPGTPVEWLAFKDLDTVSGATQSSQGIFNATVKALAKAQGLIKDE